jgi:hypothetical protein
MGSEVLILNSRKVITLTRGVKGVTRYTLPWNGTSFAWIGVASVPCSGWAKYLSSQQVSGVQWGEAPLSGDPPGTTPPGGYGTATVWDNWVRDAHLTIWGEVAPGYYPTFPQMDFRNSERYLVMTIAIRAYTAAVTGTRAHAGCDHWFRRVQKIHPLTNTVWYEDYTEGDGDGTGDIAGVTWSGTPVYHWEISAVTGTITTSGTDPGTMASWFSAYLWANRSGAGSLFPSDFTYSAGHAGDPINVYLTTSATTTTLTHDAVFQYGYYDPASGVNATVFSITATVSVSNDSGTPWSVDYARQACGTLSLMIHFEQPNRQYPPGGPAMDPAPPAPYAQMLTLAYVPPVAGVSGMQVSYSFSYPSGPRAGFGGEPTIWYPEAAGDVMPITENWLLAGGVESPFISGSPGGVLAAMGDVGSILQMKTMAGLNNPGGAGSSYQRRSWGETPAQPATHAPPSDPASGFVDDGTNAVTTGPMWIASTAAGRQYFPVPSPWQGVEIIWPVPVTGGMMGAGGEEMEGAGGDPLTPAGGAAIPAGGLTGAGGETTEGAGGEPVTPAGG